MYYDTKYLNLLKGRGQGVRIHIKCNFNHGRYVKGRVKVISVWLVLNCNLILKVYGGSSFGSLGEPPVLRHASILPYI